jgi:hypothetical protein
MVKKNLDLLRKLIVGSAAGCQRTRRYTRCLEAAPQAHGRLRDSLFLKKRKTKKRKEKISLQVTGITQDHLMGSCDRHRGASRVHSTSGTRGKAFNEKKKKKTKKNKKERKKECVSHSSART